MGRKVPSIGGQTQSAAPHGPCALTDAEAVAALAAVPSVLGPLDPVAAAAAVAALLAHVIQTLGVNGAMLVRPDATGDMATVLASRGASMPLPDAVVPLCGQPLLTHPVPVHGQSPVWLCLSPRADAPSGILGAGPIRFLDGMAVLLGDRLALAAHGESLRRERDALAGQLRAERERAADLSHELRTPLTGLLGLSEMVMQGDDPAQLRRLAGSIHHCGAMLLAIVERGLDGPDQGTAGAPGDRLREGTQPALGPVSAGPLDVASVLATVVDLMTPLARQRGLALGLDPVPPLPPVLGDRNRLTQALVNLITNAIKYTPDGQITLGLEVADRPGDPVEADRGQPVASAGALPLVISVRDTGMGIEPAEQVAIFRRAHRSPAATAGGSEGQGLGLAITASLVEAMGGRITVESRPGAGSCFALHLPLVVTTDPGHARPEAPAAAAGATTGRCVLVVEDTPVTQMLLVHGLSGLGHRVEVAETGAAALALAASGRFDIVLMDLMLPDMAGTWVARQIRALPGVAGQVAILGLTADPGEAAARACLAAGMDAHLAKPFRLQALAGQIADLTRPRSPPRPGLERVPASTPAVTAAAAGDRAAAVDPDHIQDLMGRLGRPAVAELIARALADADHAVHQLEGALATGEGRGLRHRIAHDVAGMLGNLGLCGPFRAFADLPAEAAGADLPTAAGAHPAVLGLRRALADCRSALHSDPRLTTLGVSA